MTAQQVSNALALLEHTPEEFPRWPWPTFNREVGGLAPGRLTIVGARPGGGKTTVLLNALRKWLEDGLQVCYAGTEQSPEETWQRLAALELSLAPVLFLEHRWDEIAALSGRSVKVVEMDTAEMLQSVGRRWAKRLSCVDLPRLTAKKFLAVAQEAIDRGCEVVVLDHVLRLRYGLQSLTAEVGDLVTEAKELATRARVHIVLAAQLARPAATLGLSAHLTPPRAEQLKQSGALEQEADVVLLLHRVPRTDIDNLALQAVRTGKAELATLFQEQVLGITVGKHRFRSHLADRTFRLWVEPWDEITEVRTFHREPGEDDVPF